MRKFINYNLKTIKTMKNIKWLMSMFAIIAFALVGCGEDPEQKPTPEPTPEPGNEVSFEITLGEVDANSVEFSVTPSDLEAEYFVTVYDTRFVDAFSKDQHVVGSIYDELAAYAGKKGMTLDEYLAKSTDKGVIESATFTGLAAETDYYILVFAVNPADGFSLVGSIEKVAFTTGKLPSLECTFEVEPEVYYNSVTFSVKPSNKEAHWHMMTMPKASYVDNTEGAGWTKDYFYQMYLQNELQWCQGMTTDQIIKALFPVGDNQVKTSGLVANTEYVYLVAAIIIEDDGSLFVASEPMLGEYTTEDALPSKMTFTVKVDNVEPRRASILVQPSNKTESFVWRVAEWDGKSTAQEVMESIVAAEASWLNGQYGLSKGTQDYTGNPGSPFKYRLDAPDTDYYVIAFGYAGGITTAPEMVTFHTLDGGDPAEAVFNMTARNPTTFGFTLDVTVDNPNIYYTPNVMPASEYDEEALIAEWNEYITENYEFYCSQNSTFVSMATYLSNIAYADNLTGIRASALPDSDIMGYVFALDVKTGHVVKAHTFPNLAKTKSMSSLEPSIELVGYYSGDDEAGQIFNEPTATAGKAIAVCKYDNFDGAKALYYGYDVGNRMSTTELPDPQFISAYSWTTYTVLDKPYFFGVAEWQTEYTLGVYALDPNGLMSRPARMLIYPTADEKSPIDDLLKLYDELYPKQTSAMPLSVVYNEEEFVAPSLDTTMAQVAEQPAVVEQTEVKAPQLVEGELLVLDRVFRVPIRK